jgi:hypothetical protein
MVEPLQKTSVIVNNASLQTFSRNGLYLNSKPIEELVVLEVTNLAVNQVKTFNLAELNIALKPLSLWVKYPSNPLGTITLNLLLNGTVINSLLIPATLVYSLPFTVIRPGFNVSISSDKAIDRVVIFAEQISILDTIYPTS